VTVFLIDLLLLVITSTCIGVGMQAEDYTFVAICTLGLVLCVLLILRYDLPRVRRLR
jgi:hypothetical protein